MTVKLSKPNVLVSQGTDQYLRTPIFPCKLRVVRLVSLKSLKAR